MLMLIWLFFYSAILSTNLLFDVYVPFSTYCYNFRCPSMKNKTKMKLSCASWNLNALKDQRRIFRLSLNLEFICRVSWTLYCHLSCQWKLDSFNKNINVLYLGHDGPLTDLRTPKIHRFSVTKNINGLYPGRDHLTTDRCQIYLTV